VKPLIKESAAPLVPAIQQLRGILRVDGGFVTASEPPVIGKRYLFRDGVFVRAKPRENEVIYRFDGVNFRACGLG
jgi:hypothetical protein